MKATSVRTASIQTTTWDSTLQWVAGLAWLLSVWALAATAHGAEIKTAVVPSHERGVAQVGNYSDTNTYGRDRTRPTYNPNYGGSIYNTPVNNFLPTEGIGFGNNRYKTPTFSTPTDNTAPLSTMPVGNCPNGQCGVPRPNYNQLFNAPGFNQPAPTQRSLPFDHFEEAPYNTNRPVFPETTPAETLPVRFPSNRPPVDPYSTPAPGSANIPTPSEKIEYRYSDPLAVQLGRSSSLGNAVSLYLEASNLIDSRHVSPVGYEARNAAALNGLATALESRSFLQAAGVNASPNQVRGVQQQLRTMAQRPARSSSEAVGQMQQAASLVNRSLRVPQGMVAMEYVHSTIDALDRFSAIVPRKSAIVDELAVQTATIGTDLELRTAGLEENIVGVGVEMKTDNRGAIVLGTINGGPAAEAGVQKGDIIVGINGQSVAGMSLAEIAQLIGGPSGSRVTFSVNRSGQNGTLSMTRRSMYVSSVASVEMIDPNEGVGYARLKQFSANSAKDLESALWELHRQGMKSFVLDLRGNPGGLLTSAIEISNLFLPCGQIVSTRGRNADDNTQEVASYTETWRTPLVVLIDDGSASASEILAAAIQDNERGVVVGRRSYGKGTVQTHFPLRTVAGNLKLTTAKFYSPKGREMADAGVIPDVPVHGETDWSLATNQDNDVRAAVNALSAGRPQQLAANAVKCYQNAGQSNGFRR